MRRVILESPFSGDVDRNWNYLQRAIRDCIQRGDSPYASHMMLTSALDDGDPEERKQGIAAGSAWRAAAAATVIYEDHGISSGMAAGIDHAHSIGLPVEFRRIGEESDPDPTSDAIVERRRIATWLHDISYGMNGREAEWTRYLAARIAEQR